MKNSDRSVGNEYGYTPLVLHENRGGRPRFDVKQEQLEYLLDLGFNCPKVAEVLGVSLSTIRRRMSEFGLSVTALYSSVTDQELDVLVSQIVSKLWLSFNAWTSAMLRSPDFPGTHSGIPTQG